MYARKLAASLATVALSTSAVAVLASPAHAAVEVSVNDTSFLPVAADLVGVGSDTSEHAVKLLAEGFNAKTPAPAFKISTFAALPNNKTSSDPVTQITVAAGTTIDRPNGSGKGKATLFGAGNVPAIDYARSSSALNNAEVNAGLKAFPFALDTLVMAVKKTSPNAPAALTPQNIVDIYKGTVTNWNQIGGTAGVIKPYRPQDGSGTLSFFVAQLKAMNGNVDVTFGPGVLVTQEHSDTDIKNDANAIAPFSEGRANLAGTLRVETGFRADRALYNVVRGGDVGKPDVLSVFGENGYFCSIDARELIEEAGFKQLATPADSGACGAPTTAATSNFTLNERVVTTTTVSVTSPKPGFAQVVATVSGSTAPAGTVTISEGAVAVATDVPLTSGQAKVLVQRSPGTHTFTAVFTPADESPFESSTASGTGFVKTSSKITETFAAKLAKGKKGKPAKAGKGSVIVTLVGTSAKATGKVVVKIAKKTISANLVAGKASFKLPKLKKGKYVGTATWAGNTVALGSTVKFNITQK